MAWEQLAAAQILGAFLLWEGAVLGGGANALLVITLSSVLSVKGMWFAVLGSGTAQILGFSVIFFTHFRTELKAGMCPSPNTFLELLPGLTTVSLVSWPRCWP